MHRIFEFFAEIRQKIVGGGVKKRVKFAVIFSLVSLHSLCFGANYSYWGASSLDVATCGSNDHSRIDYNWGYTSEKIIPFNDNVNSKSYIRLNLVSVGEILTDGDKVIGMKFCPIEILATSTTNTHGYGNCAKEDRPATDCLRDAKYDRRRGWLLFNKINDNCIWLYTGQNGAGKTGTSTMPALSTIQNYSPDTARTISNMIGYRKNPAVDLIFGTSDKKCNRSGETTGETRISEHANLFVVEKRLDHGAYVQLYTVSGFIDDDWTMKNRDAQPYLYLNSNASQVLVCLPGYVVNSSGNNCIKYCGSKPDVCSYTNGSYGTWGKDNNYKYTMNECSCECDDTSCKWTASVKETLCSKGYFGKPVLKYDNGLSVVSGSCTRCPQDGVTLQWGTTNGMGATKKTDCYRTPSDNNFSDDTGWYREAGEKCPYVE